MTLQQSAARNEMIDWQVAPAENEIANYDEPKVRYRKAAEQLVNSLRYSSLKKKPFFTISTNVLCADLETKGSTRDPIERDLYLPLEIAISKWCINDFMKEEQPKFVPTKVWMINPGKPPRNCRNYSEDHKKKHKIEFDADDEQNPYTEKDLKKVVKEINSYLTPDRTVFSMDLRRVRQDLGCLKWLNRETGFTTRPISVLSIDDLYVCLIRRFNPEMAEGIGYKFARYRLDRLPEVAGLDWQCTYHQNRARLEDGETYNCAKEIATHASIVTAQDTLRYGGENLRQNSNNQSQPQPGTSRQA